MAWINSDGLRIPFGLEEAVVAKGGDTAKDGDRRESVIDVDLTALNTSTPYLISANVGIAKNARIEEVEVEVLTAATSGGSATLDVGFIRSDYVTELDYNGLVAAAALSTINTAGKRLNIVAGGTAAGALLGTSLAYNGFFVATAGTAVFTAGLLRVRVKYMFL